MLVLAFLKIFQVLSLPLSTSTALFEPACEICQFDRVQAIVLNIRDDSHHAKTPFFFGTFDIQQFECQDLFMRKIGIPFLEFYNS